MAASGDNNLKGRILHDCKRADREDRRIRGFPKKKKVGNVQV